jgi:hypothetical protein
MCDESLDSKLLKQVILNLKTSYRNGWGEKPREDGVAGKRIAGTGRMLGYPYENLDYCKVGNVCEGIQWFPKWNSKWYTLNHCT